MLEFPEIEKIAEPPGPLVEQAAAWWWWAGAAVLGIIVLITGAWVLRSSWRRAALPGAPPRPEKLALRELRALRKRTVSLTAPDFGASLSGIVRAFLHRRMGMLARFATTAEILGTARRGDDSPPPPPVVGAFAKVLEGCDALKFSSGHFVDRESLLTAAEEAIHAISAALQRQRSSAQSPLFSDAPHAPAP